MKLVSDFCPQHPITGLCRGLFCAVFRNFAKQNHHHSPDYQNNYFRKNMPLRV